MRFCRLDLRKALSFWTGFDSVLDVEGPARPTAVPRRVSYVEAVRGDARAVARDAVAIRFEAAKRARRG